MNPSGTPMYWNRPLASVVVQPFHALSGMTDGGVDLTKTLVILDEGAEATMLSETESTGPHAGGFHCGSIELLVEQSMERQAILSRPDGSSARESSANCPSSTRS